MSGALPPLEPLAPVHLRAVELLELALPLATPLRSAASERRHRRILLVHVVAEEAEGWAECVAEVTPTYDPETVDGCRAALGTELLPRLAARSTADLATFEAETPPAALRMATAAAGLALLDAQLRAADRSLAAWLGARDPWVETGATLGLHDDVEDLLAEADEALAAGAARLRVKVAPGQASRPVRELRRHVAGRVPLQADANGTFDLQLTSHLAELEELDDLGLTCLEQPLPAADLEGTAQLAARLVTPIGLDEPLTSLEALDHAIDVGACAVACVKPARVRGWTAARRVHDRCVERGVPAFVGGMLESALGRAANAAVAALPGMVLAPDLDPRGRFAPDLADLPPVVDGRVAVPTGPGVGVSPADEVLAEAVTVGTWRP